MEKRTREIIALVLLIALGAAVACAMAWYMLVGHGWNQAATHIDNMVGSMDGYTVVLFDGVVKRPKEKAASQDGDAATRSSGSSSAASTAESKQSSKKAKVSMRKVVRDYQEKGATTLVVDMKNLQRYEEPSILKRGSKRIGVFSSSGPYRMHLTSIRAKVRYLQAHSVDVIVVLADDRSMMTDRIAGADLLLLSKGGGLPGRGGTRGSLFCVDSPYKGEVQSVIISPSNVLTAQTIKEL